MIRTDTARLQELRIKAGLSQRALARDCGLSNGFLSQLERGEREPGPAVAKRLCEALHVAFDELFRIVNPQPVKEVFQDAPR
jgi:transcriptional regulator with XRE-family HTH domain